MKINRAINRVESMLATAKPGRFDISESESIEVLVRIVKELRQLLDLMGVVMESEDY